MTMISYRKLSDGEHDRLSSVQDEDHDHLLPMISEGSNKDDHQLPADLDNDTYIC